jgi:methylenetetrahydrofolate dehydrogenase (NADP+)/methenyltetrahydrofolate cyclohydrolase
MSARRLDGVAAAAAIRAELIPVAAALTARLGRAPALTIIIVGDDPPSNVYVRNNERGARETGLAVEVLRLPAVTSLDEVLAAVARKNRDSTCDGILVQSPLPEAMGPEAEQRVFDAIDPDKDVDGFHPVNVGRLVQGRAVLAPCTPSGIIALLERNEIPIAGQRAVVIGRSDIVGKPMALMLLQRHATVTICHSRTVDLASVTREADLVVAALGRPGFVGPEMIKPGAAVVDVGTTPISDPTTVLRLFGAASPRLATLATRGVTVVGDVHSSVAEVAGALTPVPGGVGPLTIAMLLGNTLRAAGWSGPESL